MLGDVALHRESFYDWGGPEWVYTDGRLDLLGCPDEKLLEFLAFVVHPLVRPDQDAVDEIVKTINQFLIRDGYQLEPVSVISGKRIFAAIMVTAQHAADTKDGRNLYGAFGVKRFSLSSVRSFIPFKFLCSVGEPFLCPGLHS
jgi:hypothetical protein